MAQGHCDLILTKIRLVVHKRMCKYTLGPGKFVSGLALMRLGLKLGKMCLRLEAIKEIYFRMEVELSQSRLTC